MTNTLTYQLELTVSDDPDVDDLEEFLQVLLVDLHEQGDVQHIKITRSSVDSEPDADAEQVVDLLDKLDSDQVRKAIDLVESMEDLSDDDG